MNNSSPQRQPGLEDGFSRAPVLKLREPFLIGFLALSRNFKTITSGLS